MRLGLGQYSPHEIMDWEKTMNLNVSQSHLCDCGEKETDEVTLSANDFENYVI